MFPRDNSNLDYLILRESSLYNYSTKPIPGIDLHLQYNRESYDLAHSSFHEKAELLTNELCMQNAFRPFFCVLETGKVFLETGRMFDQCDLVKQIYRKRTID